MDGIVESGWGSLAARGGFTSAAAAAAAPRSRHAAFHAGHEVRLRVALGAVAVIDLRFSPVDVGRNLKVDETGE